MEKRNNKNRKSVIAGLFRNLLLIILVLSAGSAFAQNTKIVSKMCLDSIDYRSSAMSNDSTPYFVDVRPISYVYKKEQGLHTQSFYWRSYDSRYNHVRYDYLHVLRDVWGNIIDSNQKYLTEKASYNISTGASISKLIYDYDDNGNIVRVIGYSGAGINVWQEDSRGYYTYDDMGILVEYVSEIYSAVDGGWVKTFHEKYEYTYDSNGNVTLFMLWRLVKAGVLLAEKREYTYDANGNMVEELVSTTVTDGATWRPLSKYEYTYDSRGNVAEHLVSHFWSFLQDWRGLYKHEYTYDANGNMITKIEQESVMRDTTLTGFSWLSPKKEEYTYDNRGNVINILRSSWIKATNQWENFSNTEYVFDSVGNMTLYHLKFWSGNQWGISNPSTWEYTYLPYLETDVVLPIYSSDDYYQLYKGEREIVGVDTNIKLKGVVSEIKASIYYSINDRTDKIITYHWSAKEIEVIDSVAIVDANLSSLTVTTEVGEKALTPKFDSLTLHYTVNVSLSESYAIIAAIPSNPAASITGDVGMKPLQIGINSFPITVTAGDGVTTKTYTVVVNRTDVGIDKLIIDNGQLKVYPNPTTGQLTISLPNPSEGGAYDAEYVIFSVVGQVLLQGQLGQEGQIDVSNLANGMYFLRIENKVVRFLKE